ncbi:hypothetical protein EDD16DRAFT_1632091 [Pisolithus croceorrhizus]|nr:hypothetical protein EDD16DRAFT_1632091 [Pisolithus croceorrhizus]KAI6117454.1 hypothetical protein EV401DRAFT_1969412 [Pisolithus croceorrhizus]KAI6150159.1 hypothetical protein EDD17DRAFT_1639420 [Pisolithus thermaeus]
MLLRLCHWRVTLLPKGLTRMFLVAYSHATWGIICSYSQENSSYFHYGVSPGQASQINAPFPLIPNPRRLTGGYDAENSDRMHSHHSYSPLPYKLLKSVRWRGQVTGRRLHRCRIYEARWDQVTTCAERPQPSTSLTHVVATFTGSLELLGCRLAFFLGS